MRRIIVLELVTLLLGFDVCVADSASDEKYKTRIVRETRWAIMLRTDGRNALVSKVRVGLATITVEELKQEWSTWSR
jgi:hypothetical protein